MSIFSCFLMPCLKKSSTPKIMKNILLYYLSFLLLPYTFKIIQLRLIFVLMHTLGPNFTAFQVQTCLDNLDLRT